jgi:hypothetical protein
MYKQLKRIFKKWNTKRTNNPINTLDNEMNRQFSKEEVQMANTGKDVQHS